MTKQTEVRKYLADVIRGFETASEFSSNVPASHVVEGFDAVSFGQTRDSSFPKVYVQLILKQRNLLPARRVLVEADYVIIASFRPVSISGVIKSAADQLEEFTDDVEIALGRRAAGFVEQLHLEEIANDGGTLAPEANAVFRIFASWKEEQR